GRRRPARSRPARARAVRARRAERFESASGQGDRPVSIGARFPKSDGVAKADGSGIYADDISLPRMLYAKILRSPHAHARIRGIDLGAALAHPGVVATLVGAELPAKYGVIPWTQDETALAVEKVRHVGDAVACVAAVDERTADEALRLVKVDYEVLPAVLTPEDALEHPEIKVNERAKVGNVTKHVHLQFGEVDEAVAGAADRKSTRLNSSHLVISYAVFCLKKKK